MSDIPYSVRDKNIRVNAIKGFNFADIGTDEMFKKVDENNVGGTDIVSTQTTNTNKLTMDAGTGILKVSVGVLEGITNLISRSLHINVSGVRTRGMTIFDNGETSRVGIGVTDPEEDLEVDGNPIYENVLDASGNETTHLKHELRYLLGDGTQTTKEEYLTRTDAYIAAFVGCTYHCG